MKVKLLLGLAALVGIGLAGTASAQDRVVHRPPPRPLDPCSVTVEDAGGRILNTYYWNGQTFVLGEKGERYSIRVQNRSRERVEAVVTVDGRDVINGRRGDYVANRGYVIDAHDSVSIRGFRQSLDSVATFRFASPRNSYSARRGTPQNVGVIGVACFRERRAPVVVQPPIHYRGPRPTADDHARAESAPAPRRPRASSGGYAPPPRSRYNLGTEYGESRYAPVSTTSFVRENHGHPQQLVTVHYDDADGLEARGIRIYWFPDPDPVHVPPPPEPFPDSRFAPPPPR